MSRNWDEYLHEYKTQRHEVKQSGRNLPPTGAVTKICFADFTGYIFRRKVSFHIIAYCVHWILVRTPPLFDMVAASSDWHLETHILVFGTRCLEVPVFERIAAMKYVPHTDGAFVTFQGNTCVYDSDNESHLQKWFIHLGTFGRFSSTVCYGLVFLLKPLFSGTLSLTGYLSITSQSMFFSENTGNDIFNVPSKFLHDSIIWSYVSNSLKSIQKIGSDFIFLYHTTVTQDVEVKHFPKVGISKQLWYTIITMIIRW